MQTKQISILLTRLNGRFSTFIYWVTGRRYTHASLRLDGADDCFYSFNYRGLCAEKPTFFSKKRVSKSVLYRVEVPACLYEELRGQLGRFLCQRSRYRYSRLGVCLCLLHIPHRFPDAFFCSQFVAELLVQAGVIELDRSASLCTPNRLEQAVRRCRGLRSVVPDPVLA